jgi:hypothetical protein
MCAGQAHCSFMWGLSLPNVTPFEYRTYWHYIVGDILEVLLTNKSHGSPQLADGAPTRDECLV